MAIAITRSISTAKAIYSNNRFIRRQVQSCSVCEMDERMSEVIEFHLAIVLSGLLRIRNQARLRHFAADEYYYWLVSQWIWLAGRREKSES